MSRVLALYEYQARKDGELSFNKGDIISLDANNRTEARWWHGTSEANPGTNGKFPANYVSVIDPSSEQIVRAVAGYAFAARSHNEISLDVGEEVLVINPTPDAKWLMAEGRGRRGKIPANYVTFKEEDDEPPPPPVPEEEEEEEYNEPPPPTSPSQVVDEPPPPPVARTSSNRPAAIVPPNMNIPPPVSRTTGRAPVMPPPADMVSPVSPEMDVPPPVARRTSNRSPAAIPTSPTSPADDIPPPVARGAFIPPPAVGVPPPVARTSANFPPAAVPTSPVSPKVDIPPPVARTSGRASYVPPPPADVMSPTSPETDVPPPVARTSGRAPIMPPPPADVMSPTSPETDIPPPVARTSDRAPIMPPPPADMSPTSPESDIPPPAPVARSGGRAAAAAALAAAFGGRPPMAPPPVEQPVAQEEEGQYEEGQYEEGQYEEGGEADQGYYGGGTGEGQYEYYDETAGEGNPPLSPFGGGAMEEEESDEAADGFLFNEPDMEDTIQLNESGMLLGGTLVKTIDFITRASSFSSQSARSNALQAMAQCFRIYCSPSQFFGKIKACFMSAIDNVDIVQSNCLELIMLWVKASFHVDLAPNKALLERLQDFMLSVAQANTTISAKVCEEAQKVNQLTRILGTEKMSIMDASAPLEPESYPDTPEPKPTTILSFNSLDIAQQLCLVQFNIMSDISVSELLKEAWKRSDADKRAPGLLKHLAFERNKTLWLEEMVVSCKKDGERKKVLEKYSEIAEQCLSLSNYSAFVMFMRVLDSPHLKAIKKIYSSKTLKRLESFRPLMDNDMKEIRIQQDSRSPSIPYVKLWMSEITKLDQANPDYYENTKLINWRKVQLLGMFLRRPQEFVRSGGYKTLTIKPPVVAFIHSMQPTMTAEQVMSQALALQK